MAARQKLNSIHVLGNLMVAALVGTWAGSWAVFAATFVVLVGLGLQGGEIRPQGRR